ncbi:hypothetical protein J007_00952 [Cryptococcus neoformans]|nr:hypothetical protein J007_00952 [Cryptococcus neoformans var. grubii]OXC64466.1 hypothetical protein C358_00954 [Cryptococcus neoformans var. grubii MW-RSA852]
MIERVIYIKFVWKRLRSRVQHMLKKRWNDSLLFCQCLLLLPSLNHNDSPPKVYAL